MKNDFVEFFGLSGGGKSFLLAKCSSNLDYIISPPVRPNFAIVQLFYTWLNIKLYFLLGEEYKRLIRIDSYKKLIKKICFRYAGMFLRDLSFNNSKIALKDSGVLMPIVSASIHDGIHLSDKHISILLDCLKFKSKSIFVDVSPLTAMQIFSRREGNCEDSNHQLSDFEKGYKTCQKIFKILNRRNFKKIIKVDNNVGMPDCKKLKFKG